MERCARRVGAAVTVRAKTAELMLAGWSETHNGGCKVSFFITAEDLEFFRMMTVAKGKTAGQRIMAAMVEIGDDEQPKDVTLQVSGPVPNPEPKAPSKSKFPDGLKGLSVRWCLDEHCQRWMHEQFDAEISEAGAKVAVLEICGIQSRNELDTNAAAQEEFNTYIREPYAAQRRKDGLDV